MKAIDKADTLLKMVASSREPISMSHLQIPKFQVTNSSLQQIFVFKKITGSCFIILLQFLVFIPKILFLRHALWFRCQLLLLFLYHFLKIRLQASVTDEYKPTKHQRLKRKTLSWHHGR
jgi:hypothetical protein